MRTVFTIAAIFILMFLALAFCMVGTNEMGRETLKSSEEWIHYLMDHATPTYPTLKYRVYHRELLEQTESSQTEYWTVIFHYEGGIEPWHVKVTWTGDYSRDAIPRRAVVSLRGDAEGFYAAPQNN